MRLFIAIRLSEEMCAKIAAYQRALRAQGLRAGYSHTENLHLTLAFLGERPDADAVIAALEKLTFSPFPLSPDESGRFGDVFWIGLKESAPLTALVRDLRALLKDAGIAFDKKPFRAHITVARYLRGEVPAVSVPHGEMRVSRVSLMRSELIEGRRVYTELYAKEAGKQHVC